MPDGTPRTRLIAIVGPTAAGKTAVSIAVAKAIGGEVVNADSRLFYRGLDIGTSKPTAAERGRVRHHLVDFLGPSESFSLAEYLESAGRTVRDIAARGAAPVLTGGTGQYVWGLLEGWQVPRVPPDAAFRARLETEVAERGPEALHARLRNADPNAAARIDPRNVRRVIRAIEVAASGEAPSPGRSKMPDAPFDALIVGLTMDRADLYEEADRRIDAMIAHGWLDEVRSLMEAGVSPSAPAMTAIGYGDLASHLAGAVSLSEAIASARRATRRLIRHQYGWFRLSDERIHWFDAEPRSTNRVVEAAKKWLAGQGAS